MAEITGYAMFIHCEDLINRMEVGARIHYELREKLNDKYAKGSVVLHLNEENSSISILCDPDLQTAVKDIVEKVLESIN